MQLTAYNDFSKYSDSSLAIKILSTSEESLEESVSFVIRILIVESHTAKVQSDLVSFSLQSHQMYHQTYRIYEFELEW